MKLRSKISRLFTLLFVVVFFAFFVLTSSVVENVQQQTIDTFSTQTFAFKSEEIGNWLKGRLSEVQLIAAYANYQGGDLEQVIPYISMLNETVSDRYGNAWGTFAVGYNDGIGWVNEDISIDISQRAYFDAGLTTDQEFLLSDPVRSRTDDTSIALLHYILRDANGNRYGFLNAALSLNKLEELVKQIDFYNGTSWIMRADGILYTACQENSAGLTLLANKIQSSNDTGRIQLNDGRDTIFYTHIPYTPDWYLCTAVDTKVLYGPVERLRWQLLILFALALLLVRLCAKYLAASITRPIEILTQSMKRAKNGDLDQHVEISSQDEIGMLGQCYENMLGKLKALMAQQVQNEKEKRQAEIRILQAQINPHFLYNTLDTLQWKAYENGQDDMVSMIQSLSTFFRISLSKGSEFIPLAKEIEHVQSYLAIQKIRFADVLQYQFTVDADTTIPVPKVILQPLVENAIQHGIKPKLVPGCIQIAIRQTEDRITISIADDGVGIPPDRLAQIQQEMATLTPQSCYGLINVCNRVKLEYGSQADIQLTSQQGIGTTVTLTLPIKKGTPHASTDDL